VAHRHLVEFFDRHEAFVDGVDLDERAEVLHAGDRAAVAAADLEHAGGALHQDHARAARWSGRRVDEHFAVVVDADARAGGFGDRLDVGTARTDQRADGIGHD
jgi:hypothetical protein